MTVIDSRKLLKKLLVRLAVLRDDPGFPLKLRLALSECCEICESLSSQGNSESLNPQGLFVKENQAVNKEKLSSPQARVLVVDDDEDTQRILNYTLKKQGFEVISKTDPLEAFHELDEINPDLVLLDLMMPGMTGFEFLSQLKKSSKKRRKIMVCSSRNFQKDRITVLERGAHDFISKPYNITELILKLRIMLPQYESRGTPLPDQVYPRVDP